MKNKSYTLEELRQFQPAPAETSDKISLNAGIKEIESRKKQLESALTNAAETGNFSETKRIQQDIAAIASILDAKKSAAAALPESDQEYTKESLKSSWNAICTANNENMKKKLSAFITARHALADQFMEIAELQQQALKDLCHVNTLYTGIATNSVFTADSDLERPLMLPAYRAQVEPKTSPKTLGFMVLPASPAFEDRWIAAFVASGDLPADLEQSLTDLILNGTP